MNQHSDLDLLVGNWEMEGTHPGIPTKVTGRSSFQWLENGTLLVWRFDWEQPLPPNAISIIGRDDSDKTYTMLYSDVRGVTRVYRISLEDRIWKMWRDAPGFSQHMTGTFSDDGNTIISHGELSRDGVTWERDLDVTYTRSKE